MYISSNMRCTSRAGEGIGVGVLSGSLAADKYLLLVCQSSGKEISASPFGQFQSFAQFGHGGGEVAHGEVRLFLGSFSTLYNEERLRNALAFSTEAFGS